jgi:hypothetical protein
MNAYISVQAPGVYRVVVNDIDCVVAIAPDAGERWLQCADVVVDAGTCPLLAALRYASELVTSANRETTAPTRSSSMDS